MNKVLFNQTGGFPLETDTLDAMQQAYEMLQALGELAGNYAIIKGCEVNGSNVSDGIVYIEGEILPFQGGLLGSDVIIQEERTQRTFEDGQSRDVYINRYATFGSGSGAISWANFKRVFPLSSAVFIDEVRMYAGDLNNIPPGWYLCDGQNGTIDLRDRFIVGYNPNNPDYDQIGNTGGEKEVTLTVNEMPAHNHQVTVGQSGNHRHNYSRYEPERKGKYANEAYWRVGGSSHTRQTDYSGTHTHSVIIHNTGGGQPHENRPPYYVLAFIQFKGI